MIEKTPHIDDVTSGEPLRVEWGNAIRDAAAAHYPGGNFMGSSRGGYHRAPIVTASGCSIIGFCCGAFSAGSSVSATVTWITAGATVAVGDTITVSDPCGKYYNTSGAACGAAVQASGTGVETGTGSGAETGPWYMIDLTCPTEVASCAPPDTGSGS